MFKEDCGENGEKAGNDDREAAHGALHLADFHCARCAHYVGCSAESNSFCYWVSDAEEFADHFSCNVAEEPGYHDGGDGN